MLCVIAWQRVWHAVQARPFMVQLAALKFEFCPEFVLQLPPLSSGSCFPTHVSLASAGLSDEAWSPRPPPPRPPTPPPAAETPAVKGACNANV